MKMASLCIAAWQRIIIELEKCRVARGIMPGLWFVLGAVGGFRWTEIQCFPVFSGNFTPSGHTVKVTSGHKVAKMEGFTLVVRMLLCLFASLFLGHDVELQGQEHNL